MFLFLRHVVDIATVEPQDIARDDFLQDGRAIIDTLCDERRLDQSTGAATDTPHMETHDGLQ